ncbi:hypothetical protein [Marispirochaeta sp.]|jgi:hypothetical protein|uniref:hypothetical protein n=1 Tax=Marispirochaeta sp. TaxID=2038653 RepID=UPI0029C6B03C|nr:hypothetical protein [Marispirochaeta sp.]
MKTYRVKGEGSTVTYVQIYEEQENELMVLVTKLNGDEEKTEQDRISRDLFQMCLDTGYLIEDESLSEDDTVCQKLSA